MAQAQAAAASALALLGTPPAGRPGAPRTPAGAPARSPGQSPLGAALAAGVAPREAADAAIAASSEMDVTTLRAVVDELVSRLNNTKLEAFFLREALAKYEASAPDGPAATVSAAHHAELRVQLEMVRRRASQSEAELAESSTREAELRAQLATAGGKGVDARADQSLQLATVPGESAAEAEKELYRAQANDMLAELQELQQASLEHAGAIEKLAATEERARTRAEDAERRARAAEKAAASSVERRQASEAARAHAEASWRAALAELQGARRNAAEAAERAAKLSVAAADADSLKSELGALRTECSEHVRMAETLQREIRKKAQELESERTARSAAEAVSTASQASAAALEERIGEMERRMEQISRGEAETAERNVALEDEATILRETLASTRDALEEAKAAESGEAGDAMAAKKENEELRKQLRRERSEHAEAQTKLEEATRAAARAQEELLRAREHLQELGDGHGAVDTRAAETGEHKATRLMPTPQSQHAWSQSPSPSRGSANRAHRSARGTSPSEALLRVSEAMTEALEDATAGAQQGQLEEEHARAPRAPFHIESETAHEPGTPVGTFGGCDSDDTDDQSASAERAALAAEASLTHAEVEEVRCPRPWDIAVGVLSPVRML